MPYGYYTGATANCAMASQCTRVGTMRTNTDPNTSLRDREAALVANSYLVGSGKRPTTIIKITRSRCRT